MPRFLRLGVLLAALEGLVASRRHIFQAANGRQLAGKARQDGRIAGPQCELAPEAIGGLIVPPL